MTAFEMLRLATLALLVSGSALAQQRQEPPSRGQTPLVTGAPDKRVQVTPRSTDSPYGSAPNPATGVKPAAGTITGFVFWNMGGVQNMGSASCQGLTAEVGTVSKSATQVLSTTSTFTAKGPMTDLSAPGAPKYMLCSYSFDKMPEHVYLRVQVSASAAEFSPAVVNASPFQLAGGNCNTTPQSTLTFILSGGELLCGENAYNINLKLTALSAGRLVPGTPLLRAGAQPGMLAPGTPQSAQPQGTRQFTPGQSGGMQNPGSKVALNPPPPPPGQRLTNADVTKMVKAGVPESAIVSSIQSSPHQFDLSPDALLGLHRAGVSQKILEAMMAQGSARPETITPTRGLPSTNRSLSRKGGESSVLKVNLGHQKIGQRVRNPHAAESNASIIAVLQQQRQVADVEAAQMKLGVLPQGQQGMLAAPGVIGPNQSSRAAGGNLLSARTAVAAPTTPSLGMPGPGQPPAAPGNPHGTRYSAQPVQNMTAISCTHNPALRILTLSGSQRGAVLSADSNYNLYTITGCSFGSAGPNNKAWVYGPGLHVDLQIQHWDDNQIAWMFDPQLRGVTDNNNVHLVLQRGDGQQLDTGGYKFYAARDTVVLGGIPALTTNVFTAAQGGHFHIGFSSPGSDAGGSVAEVSRWVKANKDRPSGNVFIDGALVHVDKNGEDFGFLVPYSDTLSGTDYFDFSKLASGFATDAFELTTWQTDPSSLCGGEGDSLGAGGQTSGNWNAQWDGNNIRVAGWATNYCTDLEVFTETFVKQSQYALQVWVTGPRGVDPWTGKPD